MTSPVVYLKMDQSVCFNHRNIVLADLAKVYCSDPELAKGIEKIPLIAFPDVKNDREVISIMKIIQEIKKWNKEIEVVNLGEIDSIVYYKRKEPIKIWPVFLKVALICMIAFFGAGISIMGYNNDVSIQKVFGQLYWIVTGTKATGPTILSLWYSVGLTIGVMVFFNHASKKRLSDEPTPFEVQMRLYEENVNDSLITGAGRKKEELDVDA